MNSTNFTRNDLKVITDWVAPNSRVLDLGCGDGSLLAQLQTQKNASGYGLELNPAMIATCIDNGINVIQSNLDKGLSHFDDDSFDYVILSLTLQAMRQPETLLQEMLRVGKNGIVTFPNFAFWRNRWQLSMTGKMPVNENLPYKWYDTPNIHLCTLDDFAHLCEQLNFNIESLIAVNSQGKQSLALKILPNLFGEIALCKFSKR